MPTLFDKLELTYRVEGKPSHSGLDQKWVNRLIADAFGKWQAATPFTFKEVTTDKADIVVRFGTVTAQPENADAGDAVGSGVTNKDPNSGKITGTITFDDTKTWLDIADEAKAKNIATAAAVIPIWSVPVLIGRGIWEFVDHVDLNRLDLVTVAVHEIGHVLGLGHSDDTKSIMYKSLAGDRDGFFRYDRMLCLNGQPIPQEAVDELEKLYRSLFAQAYAEQGKPHWYKRGHGFRQVAAGLDQTIWAIDKQDRLTQFAVRGPDRHDSWMPVSERIGDNISHVAALNTHLIMVVTKDGKLYHYGTTFGWQQYPGTYKRVSAGADGAIWAIDDKDTVRRFTGLIGAKKRTLKNTGWYVPEQPPSPLHKLSVGRHSDESEVLWGLDANGGVYRRTFEQGIRGWRYKEEWTKIDAVTLSDISVGNDGTVMGIDSKNTIWRGPAPSNKISPKAKWEKVDGSLNTISVATRTIAWGVDKGGSVYSTRV